MFKKGHYKTMGGLRAIVAQVRPVGQNNWILRGAVEYEGVLYMHAWDINGNSTNSNHPQMRLVGP